MTDSHDDPLSPPVMPEDQALRARLRYETSRLVRRRQPLLRLARVAVAAACLAVCLLAIRGLSVILTTEPQRHTETRTIHPPPSPPRVEQDVPAPLPPPSPPTPVMREWAAFDSPPAEQPARYLEAGDQYLEVAQDYAGALRCYRQALASGDPAALEIDPDDNWLVMALKRDQRKEQ